MEEIKRLKKKIENLTLLTQDEAWELLAYAQAKDVECSELIELHIQKDEYIKDLKESKGTLMQALNSDIIRYGRR
mgnify:CR=1 FL=1